MDKCPCGSDNDYALCCKPILSGKQLAETAEQLMRARYSAHVKVDVDFIYDSIHPDFREGYDHKGTKTWAENSEWHGLEVLGTTAGGTNDKEGEVEFIARYRDKDAIRSHHEKGQFKRKGEKWLFIEGNMVKSPPVSVTKTGRNEPCICGSGKKYKKCCGQ